MTKAEGFVPLSYPRYSQDEMKRRAADFYQEVKTRCSVRDFSDRPVPKEVIEHCLLAAGTAPNGANLQPWHFVAVSGAEVKRRIREAAEAEEREFYARRAPDEWLDALAPLGTDAHKPLDRTVPHRCVRTALWLRCGGQ